MLMTTDGFFSFEYPLSLAVYFLPFLTMALALRLAKVRAWVNLSVSVLGWLVLGTLVYWIDRTPGMGFWSATDYLDGLMIWLSTLSLPAIPLLLSSRSSRRRFVFIWIFIAYFSLGNLLTASTFYIETRLYAKYRPNMKR